MSASFRSSCVMFCGGVCGWDILMERWLRLVDRMRKEERSESREKTHLTNLRRCGRWLCLRTLPGYYHMRSHV